MSSNWRRRKKRLSADAILTFVYRLCLHCGIWEVETPGGFLDQCPAYQLQRWIEYFNLEPFGSEIEEQRQDIRNSISFSELVNNTRIIMAGLGGKRIDMLKPDYFRISDRSKEIVNNNKNKTNQSRKNSKAVNKTKINQEQVFKDEMKLLKKLADNHGKPDSSPWEPVMIG